MPRDLDILAPSFTIRPCARNFRNGSSKSSMPQLVQHHGDEARVQQMQHGVLVAADVGRDREPLLRPRRVERPVVELGARVAQVVPRRVEEGVAHVGLAPAPLAADRARARGTSSSWRASGEMPVSSGREVLDDRELDRQVLLRDRDGAVLVAIDDGDRRAPVALAGDAPVVQAVVDDGLARARARRARR